MSERILPVYPTIEPVVYFRRGVSWSSGRLERGCQKKNTEAKRTSPSNCNVCDVIWKQQDFPWISRIIAHAGHRTSRQWIFIFEPPFGGLGVTHAVHHWKALSRLCISDIITVFARYYSRGAMSEYRLHVAVFAGW